METTTSRKKKIPQTPSPLSREFLNLSSPPPSVDETVSMKKDEQRKVLSGWSDDWLHGFSWNGLKDFLGVMKLKLQAITARVELLNVQNNSEVGGEGGTALSSPEFNMCEFPFLTLGETILKWQRVFNSHFKLSSQSTMDIPILMPKQQPQCGKLVVALAAANKVYFPTVPCSLGRMNYCENDVKVSSPWVFG